MEYEHQCLKCGKIIPTKYPITDLEWILYCPACRRIRPVKRIISKTSFILRGYTGSKNESNNA